MSTSGEALGEFSEHSQGGENQDENANAEKSSGGPAIFPCAICWQRFEYPWQVGRHVENAHLKDQPSMCQVCGKLFQTKHGLKKHERTHSGVRPYKCAYCFKSFAQWSQWKSHEETHSSDNNYQCPECRVFFKLQEEFNEHVQSGICGKDEGVECCGHVFTREEFIVHQTSKHRRVQRKKIIPCNVCDRTFETTKEVIQHEKEEHNFTRPTIVKGGNTVTVTRDGMHVRRMVECPHCKRTMVKAGLSNHLKSCSSTDGGKTFKCRRCDEVFDDKKLFDKHKLMHLGSRFQCQYCPKSFKWKNLLTQHIRTHSGEKPLICKFCNKGFAHPSTLYAHLRGHTGVKPFTCKFCELKFTRYGTWQSHLRTHTGEKPYPCEIPGCGKSFAQKSTLTSHVKTHEPDRDGNSRRRKRQNTDEHVQIEEQHIELDHHPHILPHSHDQVHASQHPVPETVSIVYYNNWDM